MSTETTISNNSASDAITSDKKNMKTKKNHNKGPIRLGALVPFVLIFGTIACFNILFLDSGLKSALIHFLEDSNKAEVNVGQLKTSIRDLSLTISNIQLTDQENPEYNKIEVGLVNFRLSWDALLRAKFVIDDATIKDILIGEKRSSIGRVFNSKSSKSNLGNGPYQTAKSTSSSNKTVETKTIAKNPVKEEEDPFTKIKNLLNTGDSKEIMSRYENEFESLKYVDNLKSDFKSKEDEVNQLISSLSKEDITTFETRFKAINWDDLKDLKKAPKVLKEANELQKDIKETTKKYDQAVATVKKNVKFLQDSVKKSQDIVKSDLKKIESISGLSANESKNLASAIFGKDSVDNVYLALEYFEKVKEYLPPKKDKKAVSAKALRGKGRDYQFGRVNQYPIFWLKRARINSENKQTLMAGELTNLTTNQHITGRQTKLELRGDVPDKGIKGLHFLLTVDHREKINDEMSLVIPAMAIKEKYLTKSENLKFGFKEANLQTNAQIKYTDLGIDMILRNSFNHVSYITDSDNKIVGEVLTKIAQSTPSVDIKTTAKGESNNLDFDIESNLSKSFNAAINSVLNQKMDQVKAEIKNKLNGQIADKQNELKSQLANYESRYLGQVNSNKDKLSNLVKDIEAKQKQKANLKDPVKKLKKKLRF